MDTPLFDIPPEVPAAPEEATEQSPVEAAINGLIGAKKQEPPDEEPEDDKNYAEDTSSPVYDYVKREVVPNVMYTRQSRTELNTQWLEIQRTDRMVHDSNKKYNGRSNAYLPVANRNFDTLVSQLAKGLMPSEDYMDVTDEEDGSTEEAKSVKTYLQWELEKNGRIKKNLKPFLREFVKYGTAILKYTWKQPDAYCVGGLDLNPRSIFNWYIYPWTVTNIEEALMVFEDIDVSSITMNKMKKSGRWAHVEDGMATSNFPGQNPFDAERIDATKLQPLTPNVSTDSGRVFRVTEIWTYVEFDKDEGPVPAKVVIAGNETIMEIRRNRLPRAKPPYLVARMEVEPGIFYGSGFGKKVRPFQYLVNDFANQTNDNGNYALNPIAKMNPTKLVGPPKSLAPGVVMYVSEMDAIEFDRPPAEQMQFGMMLIDKYMSYGASYGGAPPQLQGSSGGKTATSSQILQRNAMTPIQDVVEDIEVDVMVPLLQMTWELSVKYRDAEVLAEVAGMKIAINPSTVKINASFRWLASSQSASSQQRAQQGVQLLGALTPPLMQLVQANGYQVDPVPLLRRIYTDAMGYRGFDQFIKQAPPPQMAPPGAPGMPGMPPGMPPGAAPPGMPPGAPSAPPVDSNVRSALEQAIGGGTGDMVPGEGEAFADVRDNADELAAFGGGES